MDEKRKKPEKKNALVSFVDSETEIICKNLASKSGLTMINGYDILRKLESEEKLKEHQKVFLFVTIYGANKNHLEEIEKLGFNSDNITLFTTHSLDAEICLSAKEKGIKVVLLPLFHNELVDYLK